MLDALAAKTPAPGGGAAGPVAGAHAAALALMVVAYSEGRKSLQQHAEAHASARQSLEKSRELFLQLAVEDAEAFGELQPFFSMKEGNPAREGLPAAAERAAAVPLTGLGASVQLLATIESLIPITNTMLSSDLAVAAVLAEASARSCAWNVRINLPLLTEEKAASFEQQSDEHERLAVERAARIEAAVREGSAG